MQQDKDSSDQSNGTSTAEEIVEDISAVQDSVAVDLKRALAGGVIAAAVTFIAVYASGSVSGMEALAILEGMLPTTRFLCSAVMTGSATILALMLTLLSLSHGAQYELHSVHYQRVQQIAWVDSIAFVAATIFLLFLNIPIGGAENVSATWFSTIYYAVLTWSSLLGGLLVSVVLMLYNTLTELIKVLDPRSEEAPLVKDGVED